MKTDFYTLLPCTLLTLIIGGFAFAGEHEKMVIKLKTNDFEIAETDISDLALGEAKTIVTDSGKTIDILRTDEGVEVYVNGELLEIPQAHEAGHGLAHKRIEIECTVDGEEIEDAACSEDLLFLADGEIDVDALHADGEARHVIVKRVLSECVSSQDGGIIIRVEDNNSKVVPKTLLEGEFSGSGTIEDGVNHIKPPKGPRRAL